MHERGRHISMHESRHEDATWAVWSKATRQAFPGYFRLKRGAAAKRMLLKVLTCAVARS